jgi:hypothetical protein
MMNPYRNDVWAQLYRLPKALWYSLCFAVRCLARPAQPAHHSGQACEDMSHAAVVNVRL